MIWALMLAFVGGVLCGSVITKFIEDRAWWKR